MVSSRTKAKQKKFIFGQSFLFVLVAFFAGYILLQSPIFIIDRILVTGNKELSETEILQSSGLVTGLNIFKADLHSASAEVNLLPMVKDVSMHRNYPSQIMIEVVEREPLALIMVQDYFVELDEQGYYLRQGNISTKGLPIITGIQLEEPALGQKITEDKLNIALQVIQEINLELRENLSEVHINKVNLITLYTLDGIECRLGSQENISTKGNTLLQVIKELKEGNKQIEYIDFSNANLPVVKYKD